MKIEFVGDRAIFLGMNRSSLYDSYDKKRMIKCSGLMDDKLLNIAHYSEQQIKQFE